MRYYKSKFQKLDGKFSKDYAGYIKEVQLDKEGHAKMRACWFDKNHTPAYGQWNDIRFKTNHIEVLKAGYLEYTPETQRISELRSDSRSLSI